MTINLLKITFFFTAFLYSYSCTENSTDIENVEPLNTNIRMEVQILDSAYHLYSRPFTRIYFTTYKLGNNGEQLNFEQSDTLSCRNGWGVKLLSYTINSKDEKIVLGAACENYNGANYREVTLDYNEIMWRADSTGKADIVKTFAIYYN